MKARIIKIGNSQGIRIPKVLLEQAGLAEEVELVVEQDQIIIRPIPRARQGWEEAFIAMASHGDDVLLDADVAAQSSWDAEEWQW